jgi:hypothetical protein
VADPAPIAPTLTAAFDLDAFEAALRARIETRPDLRPLEEIAGLATLAVAVVGLVLLARAIARRREWPAAPGPATYARWDLRSALLGVIVVGGAVFGLGAPLTRLAQVVLGAVGASAPVLERIVPGAVFNALLAGMTAVVVAAHHPEGLRGLGFRSGPRALGPAPLVGAWIVVAAFPLYSAAHYLAQPLVRALPLPKTPNPAAEAFLTTERPLDLVAIAVLAIVVAPLVEETLFRGFLFPLLRARLGRAGGIALTSLLFALLHPPVDWLAILVLGAALALAYEITGSLAAPIAAHALNNAWGIAMLAVTRHIARAP